MRISDWSSDVCSSDLKELHVSTAAEAQGEEQKAEGEGAAAEREMHGPVGIAGDQHVGRAQCDDREAVAVRNRQAAQIAGGSRDKQPGKGADRELRRSCPQVRHDAATTLTNGRT